LKEIIKTTMKEVASKFGIEMEENIEDDSVLLEIGLDSLCYAILVVDLEEKLGFDPFQMEDEIIYPRTFGEFVDLYKKHDS